ncbi:MAG: hypothetical protein K9H64_11300 [Bacteroidales bacterium]|nr:hypothetical protein [Bacteroidales bacterium]MCF8456537.1 hypothetical protein [Bacteroidales bacterium]
MQNKPIRNILGISLLLGFLLALTGCKEAAMEDQREIVAQVSDNVLYWDDVKDFVPENIGKEDSAKIMAGLINKWVLHNLKLQKAEQYLAPEQKDLTLELEEYRSSLLIFKYEQEYINKELDTVVTSQDLKSYYDGFKPEFHLEKPVLNCAYVILPLESSDFFSFRTWFRYHFDDKQEEIAAYCQESAITYYNPEEQYIYFDELAKLIPLETDNPDNLLRYNRFIELRDEEYIYLINIFDYKLKSDIAPLNIVENEIRSILLNKRKIKLIHHLEESLMNEAMDHNNIEIRKKNE